VRETDLTHWQGDDYLRNGDKKDARAQVAAVQAPEFIIPKVSQKHEDWLNEKPVDCGKYGMISSVFELWQAYEWKVNSYAKIQNKVEEQIVEPPRATHVEVMTENAPLPKPIKITEPEPQPDP
jgi:hypothetical protein